MNTVMEKVAKIIEVYFAARVIVQKNATEDEIILLAKNNIKQRLDLECGDNLTSIEDDHECPYGTFDTDIIS